MSALTQLNDIQPQSLVDLPGEQKIRVQVDTKAPSATDFTLFKEDHTLVNLLRMQLHHNPHVKFAGYRVPHPTQHTCVLKVQTAPYRPPTAASSSSSSSSAASPATITPDTAVKIAINECISMVDEFSAAFHSLPIAGLEAPSSGSIAADF